MESPCLKEHSLCVLRVRLLLVFVCRLLWERKVWEAAGLTAGVHCSTDITICNNSSYGYHSEVTQKKTFTSITTHSITFAGALGSVCMYLDFTIVPEANNQ